MFYMWEIPLGDIVLNVTVFYVKSNAPLKMMLWRKINWYVFVKEMVERVTHVKNMAVNKNDPTFRLLFVILSIIWQVAP